jgi:hypothetical protein
LINKDKLWIKAVLVIVFLILAMVGSIIVLEAHQYSVKIPTSGYNESGSFTVKENLLPNSLYNQSYLTNPTVIYNNITSSVNISAQAFVHFSNISGRKVSLVSTVDLVSNSPPWEKLIETNETSKTVSQNGVVEISIPLNITKEMALATSIDNELQDGTSDPTIVLNISVVSTGLNIYSTSMTISLHGTYEDLSYSNSNPVSVTSFKQELVTPHEIIGLGTVFGYIFLAGAGASAISMAVLYIPRVSDTVVKIRKDYGDHIVEIDTPPSEDAKTLSKLEDLIKLSEILETPVFLYANGKVLYVSHQGEQYKYVLL